MHGLLTALVFQVLEAVETRVGLIKNDGVAYGIITLENGSPMSQVVWTNLGMFEVIWKYNLLCLIVSIKDYK